MTVSMAQGTSRAMASLLHATTARRPGRQSIDTPQASGVPRQQAHAHSYLTVNAHTQRPPHSRTLSRWSVSAWSGVPTRISRSLALPPDPRPFSILSQLVLWCPSGAGTARRPGISIGADDAGRPGGAVSPPLSSGWLLLDILPGERA